MNLLLLLCRTSLHETDTYRRDLESTVREGVDWQEFVRLVLYHRLVPVVYPMVKKEIVPTLPQQVSGVLYRRFHNHKMSVMEATAEWVRLTKILNREGIDVVGLKGPALALTLYGDVLSRHMRDLDLLVKQQDIEKVHGLLLREGYELENQEHKEIFSTPRHLAAFMKSVQHLDYIHRQKKIRIEFHYRLFKNPQLFPYNLEDIPDCCETIEYGGTTLNVLPEIDNWLYLFVHGANHCWFRLKWLMDIARLSLLPGIEWERLWEQACRKRVERTVIQGLHLSHRFFDTPLPGICSRVPPGKRWLNQLTRQAAAEINRSMKENSKNSRFPGLRQKPYQLRLRKGLIYKLAVFRAALYSDANRSVLRLPDRWFPLYYLLNPFLWFYRKFSRLKR
jgi:hypothetical protein